MIRRLRRSADAQGAGPDGVRSERRGMAGTLRTPLESRRVPDERGSMERAASCRRSFGRHLLAKGCCAEKMFSSEARTLANARNRQKALDFAERLRPVLTELAHLSAHKLVAELNRRGIKSAQGGGWHPETVARLRRRLAKK